MSQLISNQPLDADDQIAWVTTYQGAMSLQIHAMGFLELASVGARAVLEKRVAIDAITPGILYAVRHATELFLKYVIVEMHEVHGLGEALPEGHELQQLFQKHLPEIQICLDEEAQNGSHPNFDRNAWLKQLKKLISEVHQLDPDGQSARYPANREGEANLGGEMNVSVRGLELFANAATDCFTDFVCRET